MHEQEKQDRYRQPKGKKTPHVDRIISHGITPFHTIPPSIGPWSTVSTSRKAIGVPKNKPIIKAIYSKSLYCFFQPIYKAYFCGASSTGVDKWAHRREGGFSEAD
jgi:hypothetical protein